MPTSYSVPQRIQEVYANGIRIEMLVEKDMTSLKVDVYCNSTDSDLDLSRGSLSRQLHAAGGEKFGEACKSTKTSNGVAVTVPGNLNCRFVIHLDIHSGGSWEDKTLKVLRKANTLPGVSSIALPAFGTGAGGHDAEEVALGIYKAIREFAYDADEQKIKHITVIAKQKCMEESFQMGKLRELSPISEDFAEVVKFCEQSGVKSDSIAKVEKIENFILEKRYYEWMKEMKGKECLCLWHGTLNDPAKMICNTGFKCGIRAANGNVYGKGSYFAMKASYSIPYLKSVSEGKLILVDVLIGRAFVGWPDRSRCSPPPEYDSVQDRHHSFYVVYNDAQSLPKYLITLK